MESWASWKRRFHGGERAGRRRRRCARFWRTGEARLGVGEAGAWRRRVRDGLTRGAIAGVRPPLGALGQTAVGHDLNGRSTVAPIQSLHQRLTARFGAD